MSDSLGPYAGDGTLTVTKHRKNGADWSEVTAETATDPDASYTNEQIISVTGKKIWKTMDGNVSRPGGVSVTLTLNRYEKADGESGWGTTAIELHTVVITISKDGTKYSRTVDGVAETEKEISTLPGNNETGYDAAMSYTWSNLPKTSNDGKVYGYTVAEKACSPGYHTADSAQTHYFTDSGVQEITNIAFSTVALPATGGPGTTLYYVAGASLLLIALAMLVLRKKQNYD